MKFLKKSRFSVLFFLTMMVFILSAETAPKGKKLCDENYTFLKKAGIKPKTQSLVAADLIDLPYNIIIRNEKNSDEPKLIFLFNGEDVYNKQEIIVSLSKYLEEKLENSDIVITYGDKYNTSFVENEVIKGVKVYMNSLNTNEKNTVIITKLTEEKNDVITGSEGHSSPSWLAKTILKSFTDCHVTKDIHFFYISQMSKSSFNIEPSLNLFLSNGYSAISTNISSKSNDNETITNILQNIADNYLEQRDSHKDNHFTIFRFFRKLLLLSEYTIVRILTVLIFLNLIIIFAFGFVKQNLQNELWKRIVKSYIIPISILLNLFCFLLGQSVFEFLTSNGGIKTTYGILVFQLGAAILLNSIYFIIEILFHKKYDEKSIDAVIFISTLINQFLFAIIDISTFPFFFIFCLLSLISLILKQNRWHLILFILMILVYIPYINRLYLVSDFEALTTYLYTSPIVFLSISILILPIEIMWFRILTSFYNYYLKSQKMLIITVLISYVSFITLLFFCNNFIFRNKNPNAVTISNEIPAARINITTSDTIIFEDTIRTLNIDFDTAPYVCEIIVSSSQSNPIQYSTTDYFIIDENTDIFRLPPYPPENLSFNYGASPYESTVTVKAYYMENDVVSIKETSVTLAGKN